MPADQVGAPLGRDLGRVNAFSPGSRWKGRPGVGTGRRKPYWSCGQGCTSVRGHPCPHVPNSLPRQPQSRHNDGLNDSPHNQGSAFTMKALHVAWEGKCRRGRRRSQGGPPLGRDLRRAKGFSPWSSWKGGREGRGQRVGGETTRNCGQGCPRTKWVAPARAPSLSCERLLPIPVSVGVRGVRRNLKGTAGRDARGPKLRPQSQRRRAGG